MTNARAKGQKITLVLPLATIEQLEKLSHTFGISRGAVVATSVARHFHDSAEYVQKKKPRHGKRRAHENGIAPRE